MAKERLYDRLVHTGVVPAPIKALMQPQVPVVVVDDVARWYFASVVGASDDAPAWWDETADIPNAKPPFDLVFMEARIPQAVNEIAQTEAHDAIALSRVGFLIETYRVVDIKAAAPFGLKELAYAVRSGLDPFYVSRVHVFIEDIDENKKPFHVWTWVYPLTEDGRLIPDLEVTKGKGILMGGPSSVTKNNDAAHGIEAKASYHGLLFIPLLAIGFISAPTSQIERIDTFDSGKQNRHKAPKAAQRYFRLKIDDTIAFLKSSGRLDEAGHKQAIKYCWEHFRPFQQKPAGAPAEEQQP